MSPFVHIMESEALTQDIWRNRPSKWSCISEYFQQSLTLSPFSQFLRLSSHIMFLLISDKQICSYSEQKFLFLFYTTIDHYDFIYPEIFLNYLLCTCNEFLIVTLLHHFKCIQSTTFLKKLWKILLFISLESFLFTEYYIYELHW